MTSLEARIRDASSRHRQLLQILKDTDHGAPDLANQERYIADLNAQIRQQRGLVEQAAGRAGEIWSRHRGLA